MLATVTPLSSVVRLGFAVFQAPPQESKWLSEFVHHITLTWWIVIGVTALVLLGIILYYFTIDEIELAIPPKIKFKRRGRSGKVDSESQPVLSSSQSSSQTAASHGMNVGHDLTGPTFTGEIHGDVFIG